MGDMKINFNPRIPSIPKLQDKTKINVRYMVIDPYVSIHIYWDAKLGEIIYEVEEPLMNSEENENLGKIENAIREVVNMDLLDKQKTAENLVDYIDKTSRLIISELALEISEESFSKIFYYLYRNFIGLNEIEAMMKDYFIEDIECNGFGEPIYIVHRVFRNIKTNVKFKSIDSLTNFVEKLAQKTGRYVSYASPILDGSLPDGSRVNATYTKDISSKGPTFTIRKFTKTPWTPTQLIGFHTLSPDILAYLWILLEYDSNLMIVGGTASGKTTLLNAIAFFIPPEKRVVSIEDTRELNLPRENWLPSVVRSGVSGEGIGEVDMFSLLKSSFRQNPDYVIVGEVRGKEASVLFQGMASGHSSISTMHADSVDAVIRRLETPPISLSPMLVDSLDAVIIMTHAIVKGQETRRLREITEVIEVKPDGTATTNTPFIWDPAQDIFQSNNKSKIFDKISDKFGLKREDLIKELENRTTLLKKFYTEKILSYEEVQKIVNEYQKNPQAVLKRYGLS